MSTGIKLVWKGQTTFVILCTTCVPSCLYYQNNKIKIFISKYLLVYKIEIKFIIIIIFILLLKLVLICNKQYFDYIREIKNKFIRKYFIFMIF